MMTTGGAASLHIAPQGLPCDTMAFALPRPLCDTGIGIVAAAALPSALRGTFPLTWPGPQWAGLFFCKTPEKTFAAPAFVIESATIITNHRGTSCGKFLSPCFWQFLCRAVCKTISSAVLLALGQVRRLPISRAAIFMLARLWAGCLALSATILTCAGAKPSLTTPYFFHRPIGHFARLACLHFCQGLWPAFGAEKELADV